MMAAPQRTCIGCYQVRTKEALIRIVRSSVDGTITIDPRGKGKGRGTYVCLNVDCISRAMQPQRLDRAFRIAHDSADRIERGAIDKLRQDLLGLLEVQRH